MARRGGWRRTGRRRFRYVDSHGAEITDEAALERIRSLAIPPAWRDVWISPSPRARLQATGVDAAGRTQYRYHPAFRAARERAKFERLLDFAGSLPALRSQASLDLRGPPLERDWACAVAAGLINKTWFRVGSDRHARRSRTYGVTTLRKQHVAVEGDVIVFRFRTKNGTAVRRDLRSRPLARALGQLLDLPDGSRVFRYLRDGELVDLTSATLNAYLGEHLGNGFTAKDFRTWGGTLRAALELERQGPAADETHARRALRAAMAAAAQELANTPAVARDSYVSPAVVDAYRAGRTLADYRGAGRGGVRGLSADELALRRLLRAAASG